MSALRLALMNNRKFKGNVRAGSSNGGGISISTATEDDADIYLNPEYDNTFYTATANAFDHSQTIREYFHDNRSRVKPDNKSLWPLRYQAYRVWHIMTMRSFVITPEAMAVPLDKKKTKI